jgi:hypothetical protein
MMRTVGTVLAAAALVLSGSAAAGAAQPQSPTCGAVDLALSVGRVEGAAGTLYREVLFTNRGITTCVLRGYPGVSYVDSNGNQVGSAAVRVGATGPLLTLPPSTAVVSNVGFAQVDNFDPDQCRKTPVWGVRVYSPDERTPLYLPLADQYGCAGDVSPYGAQLTVAAVQSTS